MGARNKRRVFERRLKVAALIKLTFCLETNRFRKRERDGESMRVGGQKGGFE